MPNGNVHDLRAVKRSARLEISSTTPASVTGTPARPGSWHIRLGPLPQATKGYISAAEESRYGLCSDRRMVRTLTFALISILFAGCGTSNTSGAVDTTAGAGAGGAHAGAGGASAGSAATSAGSGGGSTAAAGAGAGSGGASAGSGGAGAGAGGGGPLSCGSQTCGATQYCVEPCCGGNLPACVVKPDGGTCPAGTHQGCSNGVQCMNPSDCCQSDPCTPPPPYCRDEVPAGCLLDGGTRTCRVVCS